MSQYVSVLKLDGVPILPPLMTTQTRNEARHYKKMAINVEQKLSFERRSKSNRSTRLFSSSCSETDSETLEADECNTESTARSDDSFRNTDTLHLKISNRAHQVVDLTCRTPERYSNLFMESKVDNGEDVGRLSSISYVMGHASKLKDVLNIFGSEMNLNKENMIPIAQSADNGKQDMVSKKRASSYNSTANFITSSPSKSTITSRVLDEPLVSTSKDDQLNVTIPLTEGSFSGPNKLIRSNSYTNLTPSPLLQLKSQGVTLNKTSASMDNISKKLSETPNTSRIAKPSALPKKLNRSLKIFTPSPSKVSTIKLTSKNKPLLQRANSSAGRMTSNRSTPVTSTITKSSPKSELDVENIKTLIAEMEAEQKRQLLELQTQQQRQQEHIQELFNQQRQALLREFRNGYVSRSESLNDSPAQQSQSDDTSSYSSPAPQNLGATFKTDDDSEFFTPQNETFSQEEIREKSSCSRKLFARCQSEKRTVTSGESQRHIEMRQRAATIINAYVRGYLCRRLFKTDQIQAYVQLTLDSLELVVTIHSDTPEWAEDPTTYCLMTRSLSQYSNGAENLHNLLFNTSIKQRMGMIAKDREIKMKRRL